MSLRLDLEFHRFNQALQGKHFFANLKETYRNRDMDSTQGRGVHKFIMSRGKARTKCYKYYGDDIYETSAIVNAFMKRMDLYRRIPLKSKKPC